MVKKDRKYRQGIIENGLLSALTPVDPYKFTAKVQSFLQGVGVLVSNDTPKVIERLCRLLNYSISNPKLGGLLNDKNILIYPAQTGIGKSVSIQHYVAMLNLESSLIVVNTIDEAREYCLNINYIKGTPGYAQFFSSKKVKGPNLLTPKTSFKLPAVMCLVISHKMFKGLNSYSNQVPDDFKLYQPDADDDARPRDLVVIDERLSFLSKKYLKFNELEGIGNFLKKTLENSPKLKNDKEVEKHLSSIQAILGVINEENSTDDKASLIDQLYIEPKLEKLSLPIRVDLNGVADTVAARLDEINEEVSLLKPSNISNLEDIKNGVLNTLNTFINITLPKTKEKDVTYTGGEEVYREFAIYNRDLYSVRSIYNNFGTAVVLDATAEVNSLYELSSNSNSNLEIIEAPKIRKYENLKIFKAQGHRQSANAIYKQNAEAAKKSADWYAQIISEVLDEGDKLLVISFKDFIGKYLQTHFNLEDRVVFTNWGKHVGRNEWSDCNKVVIIGWFRLPEEEAISKLFHISSLGTSDIRTMKHVTSEKIKELQLSEIADDLVQGAMRCCARIISTHDSDCKEASVYLFQDVLDGSDKVVSLFEYQFPKAKVIDWKPKARPPISSLSMPDQNKEKAIESLLCLSKSHDSYSRSVFCKELGVPPSTMNRWLKNGYFKSRLEEIGFYIEKPEGKPEQFVLKK